MSIKKQAYSSLKNKQTLLEAIEAATAALHQSHNIDDQVCLQAEIRALAEAGEIDLKKLDLEWAKTLQAEQEV